MKRKTLKSITKDKLKYKWLDLQLKLIDFKYSILEPYYIIERTLEKIKKIAQWAIFLWDDYDWDYGSVYRILHFKLKRLERGLKEGCAMHDPKDLKALSLAIKLCNKLHEDKYHERFYRRHEKKWGELKTWTEPSTNSRYHIYKSSRSKVITEEDKKLEREDVLKSSKMEIFLTERDKKWLYEILQKYDNSWWD